MITTIKKAKERKNYLLASAIFIFMVALFFTCYKISEPAIRIWDEAIYANNAVEMTIDGDLLVLKRDGTPTLYNTKPPLVIWLQSFCMRIFGMNEFAVRLPSALAALVVYLAMLIFSFKILKEPLIGIIGVLTLICADGYLYHHVARTGDLDSVLTMFITLYTLILLAFLLKPKDTNAKPYIIGIGALVILAFFTKSVAGLMPLLGLFLAVLLSSKANIVLTNKWTYFMLLLGICLATSYYYIRESMLEGYWDKVFLSEFSRLHKDIMPLHNQPYYYYLKKMVIKNDFFPFILLIPLSLIFGMIQKNKLLRDFTILAGIWSVSYLLLISYPSVKLSWYAAPLYPILSLLIGSLFVQIFKQIKSNFVVKIILALILGGLIYSIPLKRNFNRIEHTAKPTYFQEEPGYLMRRLKKDYPEIKTYDIILNVKYPEHVDATNFYIRAYNYQDGYDIELKKSVMEATLGDTVLLCQDKEVQKLKETFKFKVITSDEYCGLYHIVTVK